MKLSSKLGKAAGAAAVEEEGLPVIKESYKDFQRSRSNFPIYYLDKGGILNVVKTQIAGLAPELKPLDADGVVFDSESAQKTSKQNKALILGMDSALESLGKLGQKTFSELKSREINFLAPNVVSFLKKVSAEYSQPIKLGILLKNVRDGLVWKVENINGQSGSPANLLGVERDNMRFTRSARFDSASKLDEVVNASMLQEYEAIAEKDRSDSKLFTKAEAQSFNAKLRGQGVHLHLDMSLYEGRDQGVKVDHSQFVLDMNLISAMDSNKGDEQAFWQNLDEAYLDLPARHEEKGGTVKLGSALLTESSQSSYAGGRIAAMQGIGNKVSKRASQCADRIAILRQQENIYGAEGCGLSSEFKSFLDNQAITVDSSKLNGAEIAFVDYYCASMEDPSRKGYFDTNFPAPTNVFTLEMGDVAFAQLANLHEHVSCKSGQDRTLTLTSLRSAIDFCGWPEPNKAGFDQQKYNDDFTVGFFKTVASQGKSVVEHARGSGGVLKFNLGDMDANEQPVPGALFRHANKTPAVVYQLVGSEDVVLGLKTVKIPGGMLKKGINHILSEKMLREVLGDEAKVGQFDALFSKKQSIGKKGLSEKFNALMQAKLGLTELGGVTQDPECTKEELNEAYEGLCAIVDGLREFREESVSVGLKSKWVKVMFSSVSQTEELKQLFDKAYDGFDKEMASITIKVHHILAQKASKTSSIGDQALGDAGKVSGVGDQALGDAGKVSGMGDQALGDAGEVSGVGDQALGDAGEVSGVGDQALGDAGEVSGVGDQALVSEGKWVAEMEARSSSELSNGRA